MFFGKPTDPGFTTSVTVRGGLYNIVAYEHAPGALPQDISYEYLYRQLPAAALSRALRKIRCPRGSTRLVVVLPARFTARDETARRAWLLPVNTRPRDVDTVAADELPYVLQLCGFCAIAAPDVRTITDPRQIERELGLDRQRDLLRLERRRRAPGNDRPRGGPIVVAVHSEIAEIARASASIDDAVACVQRFLRDSTRIRVRGRIVRAYLESFGACERESNVIAFPTDRRVA